MTVIDKRSLTERDICTKFITPALVNSGWDLHSQIREEVTFTQGRVIVRGRLVSRGKAKRADYILYHQSNIPIAVIEAKDNNHSVGSGMQQELTYGEMLDFPFVFSSNGDAFLEHDRTESSGSVERELPLDAFPSPTELWKRSCASKGIDDCRIVGKQPNNTLGNSYKYIERYAEKLKITPYSACLKVMSETEKVLKLILDGVDKEH